MKKEPKMPSRNCMLNRSVLTMLLEEGGGTQRAGGASFNAGAGSEGAGGGESSYRKDKPIEVPPEPSYLT